MMKYIYRLYVVVIVLPIFVVVTILSAIIAVAGSILGGDRIFSYYPGFVWSRITLGLLLCPVSVRGKEHLEKGKPYIVTPNHSSSIDIYVMYAFFDRPFKWVMKGALRKLPVVGWASEKIGFIFVNLKRPHEVVRYANQAIEDRFSVVIFPEGTRSEDGKIGKLKKGAFRISTDTGAEILPAYIHGAHDVLPKKGLWPSPHRLELTFFSPIKPTDFLDDDGTVSILRLQNQVDRILREAEAEVKFSA